MKYRDNQWLRQKYWRDGLSLKQIALLAGVNDETIRRWMKRFNIPRRTTSEAMRGEKNPMWRKKHSNLALRKMSKVKRGKKNPSWGRRGEEHPMWKGGRKYSSYGYVLLYRPDHPGADSKGYIYEHRLVMEKHLDRPLGPEEVVHHKNGDPSDNRRENLRLFATDSEHLQFHKKEQAKEVSK